MTGIGPAEDLFADLRGAASLTGATFDAEGVRTVLEAFEGALPDAGVALSLSDVAAESTDLDYTITLPAEHGDPLRHAVAAGLMSDGSDPTRTLVEEIAAQCQVGEYMIDCPVSGGIAKTYVHFPRDTRTAADLAELPSAPRALHAQADWLGRHHLNRVAMVAVDYARGTTNVYFTDLPGECRAPENVRSIVREAFGREVSPEVLNLATRSFRVYVTFDWASEAIARVSFAQPPARSSQALAGHDVDVVGGPRFRSLLAFPSRHYRDDPIAILAATSTPTHDYFKPGMYARVSPTFAGLWAAFYGETL